MTSTDPVPMVDYPHRGAIEAGLGRPVGLRARLDPDGCARRGVDAWLDGDVVCFAETDPPLGLAARMVIQRDES